VFAITCIHLLLCIDIDGHADRLPYVVLSLLMGAGASLMLVVGVMLIESWVTIVDGGKAKVTPKWCSNGKKLTLTCIFGSEIGLCIIEIMLVPYGGGYNGTANALKGVVFAFWAAVWGGVCAKYGWKITAMLKSGGSASAQSKSIRKFMIACMFGMTLAFMCKWTHTRWSPPLAQNLGGDVYRAELRTSERFARSEQRVLSSSGVIYALTLPRA